VRHHFREPRAMEYRENIMREYMMWHHHTDGWDGRVDGRTDGWDKDGELDGKEDMNWCDGKKMECKKDSAHTKVMEEKKDMGNGERK